MKPIPEVFPELYATPPRTSREWRGFFKGYLCLFLPLILTLVSVYVFASPASALAGFLVGLAAEFVMMIILKNGRNEAVGVAYWSVILSIGSFFWLVIAWNILDVMLTQALDLHGTLATSIAVVIIIVIHVSLNLGRVTLRRLLGLYGLYWLFSILLFPSFVGGATLRFLGVGGGVPVSITFKTMQSGTSQTMPLTVKGCLVLGIGNQVMIKPDATGGNCKLRNLLGGSASAEAYSTGVESYNRSDILKISKLRTDK